MIHLSISDSHLLCLQWSENNGNPILLSVSNKALPKTLNLVEQSENEIISVINAGLHLVREDISFEGSGCAISMASASIMTDLIKGKEEVEVKEIVNDFLGMIKENPELKSKNLEEDEKTKLMCLSGVKQYPMRVKCATLSWHTLISAIDNTQEEINTEKLD